MPSGVASTCIGSPTTTPATDAPSEASIVSRPPPWASTSRAAPASPSASGAPACQRASASPNSSAESTPTRVSGHVGGLRRQGLAGRGPVVQAAVVAEQPPAVGERRGAPTRRDVPAVAERTAATAQDVEIVGASDANDASVQIGWARR